MNEENLNQEPEKLDNFEQESIKKIEQLKEELKQPKTFLPIIVTILIASWLVGVSILGAGWLISKEIAKQSVKGKATTDTTAPLVNTPIDVKVPEGMAQQGSNDAKVTVIEFADFQCPYCGDWHKTVYSNLKTDYIDSGKVKFIFWDLAFLGDESNKSAEAALCAKDQNKFWEFHDYLYSHQDGENEGAFSDTNLKNFASTVGLDVSTFNKCFDSRTYKSTVEDSTAAGASYGVNSTPTVFINGLKFESVLPYENYKQIIDSALAK